MVMVYTWRGAYALLVKQDPANCTAFVLLQQEGIVGFQRHVVLVPKPFYKVGLWVLFSEPLAVFSLGCTYFLGVGFVPLFIIGISTDFASSLRGASRELHSVVFCQWVDRKS